MAVILKVTNVSKQYRLGLVGLNTLRDDLKRLWYKFRGKEDPFLKVGELNKRSIKGASDYIWALKDINFDVEKGEVLGIIGNNGAGKSTLLKILSRVTSPTTGDIRTKGRIASLLEVGTGFHPELTGLENIYLNGAILGMTKREIKSKEDAIVSFSGCERYVDTPVKRYSSGMTVRLAFAVAAFLDPDILIVDEVLAVGDAEFQKKAIGKMQDISQSEGRTILFVSHNLLAVKSICKTGLLLEHGRIVKTGSIDEVINTYLAKSNDLVSSFAIIDKEKKGFLIRSIKISNNSIDGNFNILDDLLIDIKVSSKNILKSININIFFNTVEGVTIFASCSSSEKQEHGVFIYRCIIPGGTLNDIIYTVDIMVVENMSKILLDLKNVLSIEGVEGKRTEGWLGKFPGFIRPQNFEWIKKKLNE